MTARGVIDAADNARNNGVPGNSVSGLVDEVVIAPGSGAVLVRALGSAGNDRLKGYPQTELHGAGSGDRSAHGR